MSTKNQNVVVNSPDSQMRTFGVLVRAMFRDLLKARELSWRLFVRDVSARYRQSMLGILWAFLPPIATGMVFIILNSKKIVNFGETDIPYPVFALIGTTLWQVFTESLNAPLRSVVMSKAMLAKINFPRESLIISAFYQTVFDFLIKSLIIVGILIFFKIKITAGLLLAPLAILMLIILGMSLGLLITPLGTLYTDVQSALMIGTQFLFFLTPVVYPPPQSYPYSLIAVVNPVSPILTAARDLITKGTMENMVPFFVVSGGAIVLLFVAWVIYRLALPIIIERISA